MNKQKSRILAAILTGALLPLPSLPVLAQTQAEPAVQAEPARYEIYPVPHSAVYPEENGNPVSFEVSPEVNIVYEEDIDQYTKNYLDEILADNSLSASVSDAIVEGKTNILLGTNGSKGYVDSWYDSINLAEDLFTKNDAYALMADEENGTSVIAILGKNTDAAFYGLSTLEYMFSSFEGNTLLEVDIKDYASGELRGFIEGFYGGFDYPSRESQIKFMRKCKGNMYVFASKTDPYHGGSEWQNVYPQEELDSIAHLVSVARENKVRYVWSFHSGKSGFLNSASADPANKDTAAYQTYQTRLQALFNKFEQLYAIGVRDFHILNDDYNTGTYRDLAFFLNDVNDWLKTKDDCGPLVYCPINYCTSWSGGRYVDEFPVYKEVLSPDIYLYWTGAQVNCPVVQADIDRAYNTSGHDIVTWINYPCSEHDKAGIYLGDLTHYMSNADGLKHSKGLLSNPVNYPEANKVAYYQLMSWLWNNDSYSDYLTELWENSFKYIEPEVADSYLTIARNISNCPDSGRYAGSGFPESEYIKDALTSVQNKILNSAPLAQDQEVISLRNELQNIIDAIADFRKNCTNENLLSDLGSWLSSLDAIAKTAAADIDTAIALQAGDRQAAWTHFSKASSSLPLWNAYSPREYPEKKAKAGSKRIEPFARTLTNWLSGQLMPVIDPDFEGFTPSVYTNFPANANTPKMIDDDESTSAVWQQDQKVNDYFGIDCGRVVNIHDITIVQGASDTDHDFFHQYVLEYSTSGSTWTPLETEVNQRRIEKSGLDLYARYVRLRVTGFDNPDNPSKKNYWTKVREFTVNKPDDSAASVYSSLTNTGSASVSASETGYTLSMLEGITLQPEESIGFRLKDTEYLSAISAQNAGSAKAQDSEDGVVWSDSIEGRASARYVRLYNGTNAAISLNASSTLDAKKAAIAQPGVSHVNLETLRDGAWENLIDGDRTTYVWTGVNQAPGQSITVDLGRPIEANSVSLFMAEDNPRLYHGKVYTSTDNATWTEIMNVDYNNDIALIDGNMRKARVQTDGSAIRWVKIEVTGEAVEGNNGAAYLKLYELEINDQPLPEDVPCAFETTSKNNPGNLAADQDLTTFFAPLESETSGSLTYTVSENNGRQAVTVVQDAQAVSNAKVEVLTDKSDSWQAVGTLNEPVSVLPVPAGELVRRVRISWAEKAQQPHVYEIFMTRDTRTTRNVVSVKNPSGLSVDYGTAASSLNLPASVTAVLDDGSEVEVSVFWNTTAFKPAVSGKQILEGTLRDLPDQTGNAQGVSAQIEITVGARPQVRENLALHQRAAASGLEVEGKWGPEGTVDGDKTDDDSRWSSARMKTGTAADQNQTAQWLMIDLGEGVSLIDQIDTTFYRKCYAVDYDIFCSMDGQTWTEIDTGRGFEADNTTLNPADSFVLDKPAAARYVKLVFNQMNWNAAGIGISVREVEIFGIHQDVSEPELDYTLLENALNKSESLDLKTFAMSETETADFQALCAQSQSVLESADSQFELDNQALELARAIEVLRKTPDSSAL